MKIVVIGGSGLIGTKLVHQLCQLGHEVVSASPTSGVNTITGEGRKYSAIPSYPSEKMGLSIKS